MRDIHDYSKIMSRPYQKSTRHKPMSILDRSAQFAPFAALTGHKEMVEEKERIVDQKIILDDLEKIVISDTINELVKGDHILLTYFVKDQKKEGGSYLTKELVFKQLDEYYRLLMFQDGTKIEIENIYKIERI